MNDPKRHTVRVDRLGYLQPPHDEGDQVGRLAHRVGEPNSDAAPAQRLSLHLRSVRYRRQALGHDQRDAEHSFAIGLVPAGEGSARVGRLELRRGDHVRLAGLVVGVGGPVEPVELVVQLAAELEVQDAISGFDGLGQGERCPRQLCVEGDCPDPDAPAVAEHQGTDLDAHVQRVQDDLAGPLIDGDGDVHSSDERSS